MKTHIAFIALIIAWGLAAAAAGAFHALSLVPPLAGPLAIAFATVAFTVGVLKVPFLRGGMGALGLRRILAVHVGRFIGYYFIFLAARGRLPVEFAQRAGWGDVAAAVGALVLLLLAPGRLFRPLFVAWNWIGIADLLVAVGTAGWLGSTRPGSMAELAALPLALIPLWLVPMLIASHVFLLCARDLQAARGTGPRGPITPAL
jgi:hypothetical protein